MASLYFSLCQPITRGKRGKSRLSFQNHFLGQRLALDCRFAQKAKIINIIGRCEGAEETSFLFKRVAKSMGRFGWHDDIVSRFGIHHFVSSDEANPPFRDEEGLVMHDVEMLGRAIRCCGHDALDRSDPIIGMRAIFEDANFEKSEVDDLACLVWNGNDFDHGDVYSRCCFTALDKGTHVASWVNLGSHAQVGASLSFYKDV